MPESTEQPDADALQREVTDLRGRNAELEAIHQASPAQRAGRIARSSAAVILIVVGVLCLVLAPLAIWGRNLVLNTDRYVATLKPVASDPGVQDVIIRTVDNQVTAHIDMKSYISDVLPPRAAQALGPPLQSAVSGLVNTVTTKFVQSDAFQTLWVEVNRTAHEQINYLLTGSRPANTAVSTNQGKVYLDLSVLVDKVKAQLVAAGLTVASKVPAVGATIEIAELKGLDKARKATRTLNTIANWLPWIGLVLVAGGIATARKRRRALTSAALGVGVGMIVIGIGLLIARHIYLDAVPTDQIPRSTAQFLFDTVVRFLRWGIRLVLLVALLVALGAWVSGPSRAAVATRRMVSAIPQALGSRVRTGPVGPFVARYAMALRIAVIALGFVILILLDSVSVATVITLAVIVLVLLSVIELLRASARQAVPASPASQ
jgi:LPXTG-motif cell wall-anchored protein